MRYAVWNNKGGVGKTFLSFVLGTELANNSSDNHVILVDMCPQANLSETILGGNGHGGAEKLSRLIDDRHTVGGYFDSRIRSPHEFRALEVENYLLQACSYNNSMPENLWLVAGDPSLEIQAQAINQISGLTLPPEAWKNVHVWLKELIDTCSERLGKEKVTVFIDCNPSFSAYTELAMIAAERIIVPCTSDDSSARAIDNISALLFGIGVSEAYSSVNFSGKAKLFNMPLPKIHSVVLNRSTQYNMRASKAFGAMFEAIKKRLNRMRNENSNNFVNGSVNFEEIPDNHTVSIVCSHLGKPLYSITPGQYDVYDESPQLNPEPLNRYNTAVSILLSKI